MDGLDLLAWTGKPPETAKTPRKVDDSTDEVDDMGDTVEVAVQEPMEVDETPDDTSFAPEEHEQPELSPSDESDDGDILHDDETTGQKRRRDTMQTNGTLSEDESEDGVEDDEQESTSIGLFQKFQKHFYIDVPQLSEEEKETYEFLPGHFHVKRVLSQQKKDNRYVVRLESGEQNIVSALTFTLPSDFGSLEMPPPFLLPITLTSPPSSLLTS